MAAHGLECGSWPGGGLALSQRCLDCGGSRRMTSVEGSSWLREFLVRAGIPEAR